MDRHTFREIIWFPVFESDGDGVLVNAPIQALDCYYFVMIIGIAPDTQHVRNATIVARSDAEGTQAV